MFKTFCRSVFLASKHYRLFFSRVCVYRREYSTARWRLFSCWICSFCSRQFMQFFTVRLYTIAYTFCIRLIYFSKLKTKGNSINQVKLFVDITALTSQLKAFLYWSTLTLKSSSVARSTSKPQLFKGQIEEKCPTFTPWKLGMWWANSLFYWTICAALPLCVLDLR